MDRKEILAGIINKTETWDIIVIGGGATGVGCAVDAATRGLSVLVLGVPGWFVASGVWATVSGTTGGALGYVDYGHPVFEVFGSNRQQVPPR